MKVEISTIWRETYDIDEDKFISDPLWSAEFVDWLEGDEPTLEDKRDFICEILWENGSDTYGLPDSISKIDDLEIDRW